MIYHDPVYNEYFVWLYNQVASSRNKNPASSYWKLTEMLLKTPFYWTVLNDDNRAEDGRALRLEWLVESGLEDPDKDWLVLECSMLEMLIGLSRRLEFQSSGISAGEWFWILVENLGLKRYTDDLFEISIQEEVEEALDRVVSRTYGRNGDGGLFPLKNTLRDQRRIEIWHQMAAYLDEKHSIPMVWE